MYSNIEGDFNTANGAFALYFNTIGERNTAIGGSPLYQNSNGNRNTAVGNTALVTNTEGDDNTAIGVGALRFNTLGQQNTATGAQAMSSNTCDIGSIFGQTSSGGTAVFINSSGKLGTTTSSRRFKEEIKPMDKSSEAVLALKPVTFRYKKEVDSDGIPQFGLVAEDVEKVNPDLVVRDKEGKPYTVRYEAVNAMLLNEFLKEHRTVQAQQQEIDALKQELKDQRALIEKVTARIEMDKAASQRIADKL